MAGTELTSVGAWVVSAIKDQGITYRIYPSIKPEDEPAGRSIVYQIEPLPDLNAHGGVRALTKFAVTVSVMDAVASYAPLKDDVAKVDAALHNKKGITLADGFTLVSCVRETAFAPPPVVFKGVAYWRLGATYRAQVA